jgi:hypothetical protein
MTSPTGPDQNPQQGQPGYGAPQQPPAGYQPQGYGQDYGQGYGQGYQPAPAYSGGPAASGQRPGVVTAAAVIGIVLGALGLLGLLAIGLVFDVSVLLGVLTLVSVAVAAVMLVGGIQTMQGKSPRLLLLGGYASIALQLVSIIWSATTSLGVGWSSLLGFVLPALVVFLLLRPESKQHFASRGISY